MIKKILISQPAPESAASNPYAELIRQHDLEAVFHPFIKVEPVSEREFRDQKVKILDHTAIVLSSRHAIDHFFGTCKKMRVKVPEEMRYYGISEKVTLYIQKYVQYRKRRVFFSPTGKWEGLVPIMAKHKSEKFLIPEGNAHNSELTGLMAAQGLHFTECTMFRTVANDLKDGTTLSDFDAIVLFTPSGVRSLVENFPTWEQKDTRLICFGDTTCKAIESTSLRLDYSPDKAKVPGIAAALDAYITACNSAEAPQP